MHEDIVQNLQETISLCVFVVVPEDGLPYLGFYETRGEFIEKAHRA